ncbi:IS3 family transposase [Paenibacillus sp. chi10]|uniref:IS3 family transposase n=1 Tax=Paenibacillus suaedae TaxID=3077233 RepID=A0AAJ2N1F6_9BACL|nr:IS3 family transposase [Paenibacillus sp. chi10]MDT8976363.1 IS3 family transposase [Paenibacillus sp. chi10]
MSMRYSELQIKKLEGNPNVLRVSESNISFTPAFDLDMFSSRKPKESLKRWRSIYAAHGEAGLLEERRGKGSSGRPSSKELSVEEKLRRAEAKIKLLEIENEFLKKLKALERQAKQDKSTSLRFELVNRTVRQFSIKGLTRHLCSLAKVSVSGYYRWLSAEDTRQQKEEADERDLLLIKTHFDRLNGKAGALVIKMNLENVDNVVMNHKKIRRLMRKYNLIAKVRRANPYRKIAQATQEHKTCANLLKRHFDQAEPEKILLTDITYLKYNHGQQWGYLSCVKDGSTNEILAHHLSTSLELSLVNRTLDKLLERLVGNIHPEAILHSDQGMHYTHPEFQKRVSETGFRQSMSRRGNCYDNAPMESFFGHMKDELEYKDCTSIDELRNRINEYIHFYNTERYQWTLKKMTPNEYRNHLLAA